LAFDDTAAAASNTVAHHWLLTRWLTHLAARWLAVAEVLLMGVLAVTGRHGAAVRMLVAVSSIWITAEALGLAWPRQRPFARLTTIQPLLAHTAARSFPSRHIASALAMASIGGRAHPRLGRLMAGLGWALGLSRVGAGLHYPSDVLAGALLGALVGRLLR
jgi:undecaprenyl-diphosphatase